MTRDDIEQYKVNSLLRSLKLLTADCYEENYPLSDINQRQIEPEFGQLALLEYPQSKPADDLHVDIEMNGANHESDDVVPQEPPDHGKKRKRVRFDI